MLLYTTTKKNKAKYCISNDILNGKITTYEIENVIRKAKNGKATGIDGFPLEIISSNSLAIVPILECYLVVYFSCVVTQKVGLMG